MPVEEKRSPRHILLSAVKIQYSVYAESGNMSVSVMLNTVGWFIEKPEPELGPGIKAPRPHWHEASIRTRITVDRARTKIEYKLNIMILKVVHGHVIDQLPLRLDESSGSPTVASRTILQVDPQ